MKTVVIYEFRGRFNGKSEYEYAYPEVGDAHNCALFIAQEKPEFDFQNAVNEGLRYGFTKLEDLRGNAVKTDVLSTLVYKGFTGFYEEALRIGGRLVFYPN